jgi:hypothetical protein
MSTDRLLTEIERQRKYLERLPEDFSYPLFNSKQALESQRRNGYRNTASAAREIIDNALEAGATMIHVAFERPQRTQAFERADSVSAVAFIDDGSGMLPEMARFALSWGGGTHFDDPSFIGKFGFGLPNASINQTRRVEVYTRTSGGPIFMAALDASTVSPHGVQTIAAPVEAELPAFVQRYLHDNKLAFEHGTVVVWVKPDRLTYRMAASLREHLVDDFGVTYRYLLNKGNGQPEVDLSVERTRVKPVDPLFLDPASRYYLPPAEGGAQEILNRAISVKYFRDEETGALHAAKIQKPEEINPDDPNLLAVGAINVRIARLPVGFAVYKKGKGETTDANRRFEIRKARRGMSFVRAGREIETVDVFPRTPRDISSGLGEWPLLQGNAYHWGVEVKFEPTLDEVFGITNDKQTVRPIEDFWRILVEEEIDRALHRENNWQAKARKEEREMRRKRAEGASGPTPAETAAGTADAVAGQKPDVPDGSKSEAAERLENEAKKRAALTEKSISEARDALQKEAKYRPYRIDYRDVPSGPFYDYEWVGNQLVVLINRLHPFYTTFYADLLELRGGERAKEAVDVLLIALAKGEATMDEDSQAKLWYETQRVEVWSSFLSRALRALAQSLRAEDDDDADGEDDEPTGEAAPAASTA